MQKAFEWLNNKGVVYEFIDYKKAGADKQKIISWLAGKPLLEIINTKGTTLKKLSDEEKQILNNTEKGLELVIKNPSMIKRPILELKNKILIGFNESKWSESL